MYSVTAVGRSVCSVVKSGGGERTRQARPSRLVPRQAQPGTTGWRRVLEVLAYRFMSNHFHLLVHLPEAPEMSDVELFDRIAALYSGDRLAEIRKEWEMYARLNDEAGRKRFRERFLRRMYDVSAFMKTLKQNATMSYNCRSAHTGTMWESRFRVREYMPNEKCELMNVAAYIDCSGSIALWPREGGWSRELLHHSYSTIRDWYAKISLAELS